jgi:flagellar basal body-associated protein FliL
MNRKEEVQMRNEKGITLVTLIITVVVLFIVSGIIISNVVGRDGLLGKMYNEQANIVNEQTDTTKRFQNISDAMAATY